MILSYKYLLRPTKSQFQTLDRMLGLSRWVYNTALEHRIKNYREAGKSVGFFEQSSYFSNLRRENQNSLRTLNATSIQQLLRRLDKAYSAFFRRLKEGYEPGFPRFKSVKRFRSMEYRYGNGCKLKENRNGKTFFYLQNVGNVRVCYHRPIPVGSNITQVILKRNNGQWFVFLMIEINRLPVVHQHQNNAVGIDIGLHHLLALSDGQTIEHPHFLHKSLANLRCLQRHASRQVVGSKRQRKTFRQIACLHEHISNQRKDNLHKVSTSLANDYGLIAIEDFNLRFMTENTSISRTTHDAGLGTFRRMLAYKAERAGSQVIPVKASYTSQICSRCGLLVEKTLNERVHICVCGLRIDRDINAARNILSLALRGTLQPPGRDGQCLT